ncbi:MAG: M48 family metallopeptidase [Pseudomonadota bacterium]
MHEDLENLRFSYETKLFKAIEAELGEQRGRDGEEAESMLQQRRHSLLGDAVRITAELLPEVHAAYQECLGVIGGELTGELFVLQSNEYNASVAAHEKRFDIVVHSALLRDFSLEQLRFVFGHELGHVVFGHSRFSVREIFARHEERGMPAALASLLFRWSRAAEVSADRVGLLCSGKLPGAVSALFLTASGLQGVHEDRVLRSLRAQYDELERHLSDVHGSHGWIRTHPMIPVRFKALELAALDLVALRQQHAGFSWNGFRGIDTKIMGVLEKLDSLAEDDLGPSGGRHGPRRGPRDSEAQLALFLSLLHVALADGRIQWSERAYITDLQMAMGSDLPVKTMTDRAEQAGASFGQNALSEIRERREHFDRDSLRKVLELGAAMVCQSGRLKRPEQKALEEVAGALGGDARLVNEVVMFVQMNGPTQAKILEGWKA